MHDGLKRSNDQNAISMVDTHATRKYNRIRINLILDQYEGNPEYLCYYISSPSVQPVIMQPFRRTVRGIKIML